MRWKAKPVATLSNLAAKMMKPEYCSFISLFVKNSRHHNTLKFRAVNFFKTLVVDYVVTEKTAIENER
jgi:hypothetical protein